MSRPMRIAARQPVAVCLDFGWLDKFCLDVGSPQFGQLAAFGEIWWPQARQLTSGVVTSSKLQIPSSKFLACWLPDSHHALRIPWS
jgi:hypothetical protein